MEASSFDTMQISLSEEYFQRPYTKAATVAVRMKESLRNFKEVWFRKPARKTNDALIKFSVCFDVRIFLFLSSVDLDHKRKDYTLSLIRFIEALNSYDEKSISGILRIPNNEPEEKKQQLKKDRAVVVNGWSLLKKHFRPSSE
jgi:hypothetical protein